MNPRRFFPVCLSMVVALLLTVSPAIAQEANARISGIVTDPSKAVIMGVNVVAINIDTNVRFPTKTNSSGIYVLPTLPTGDYRIEVEHVGFKSIVEPGITLHVQDALELNFEMAIGSASETITVNGSGVNIETTDGAVSTVIDHTMIENMPLNGNSLQTLFELTPGVVTNASGSPSGGGGISVDGQRPTSNTLTVDGADEDIYIPPTLKVNNAGSGIAVSASGGTNGLLPVDAVEEYRIQTSTYSAEYGRTPGGQIEVKTRGGTNELHGSLFENFRNQVLDAQDWFIGYDNAVYGTDLKLSPLRMNDFGGTLGGPILKNRLFFFVAHESLLMNQPQSPAQGPVPDQSIRATAASVFQPYINAYPIGNGGAYPGRADTDVYNYAVSNTIRDHTTSIRVDGILPKNVRGFFRINDAPSDSMTPNPLSANDTATVYDILTFTGGLTRSFSPKISNEFTANYSVNNGGQEYSNIPQPLINAFSQLVNLSTWTEEMNVGSWYQLGAGNSDVLLGKLRQYNIVDKLLWQVGTHTINLGFDYRSKGPHMGQSPSDLTWDTGETPDSLQNGTMDDVYYSDSTRNPRDIHITNTSLYIADNWKVSPSLILSPGLRWDLSPAPSSVGLPVLQGNPNNPASITYVSAGPGVSLYATRFTNVAPRLGFAYSLRKANLFNTTVRGGGGIFFDTGQATAVAQVTNQAVYYSYLSGVPYSTFNISEMPSPQTGGGTPFELYLVDPQLRSPRTYQWSLTLDQMLGNNTTVSVSYLGNHGDQLLKLLDYYKLSPLVLRYLYVTTNGEESSYNALQVQAHSRLGSTLNVLASYSYAHALDTGSNDFDSIGGFQRNSLANSDNDIRHIFSSAIHFSPPGNQKTRLLKASTSGWSVDSVVQLQGAAPLSVLSYNSNLNPNLYDTFADVVPGVPLYVYGSQCATETTFPCPGGKGLNPAAFVASPGTRNGTSARNGYRLFGLKQFDLAMSHSWSAFERMNLIFRVDAFGLLNNPNFSGVDTGVGDYTFGQAGVTYASTYGGTNAQSGELNTVFSNGAARTVQLSLRLRF